MYTDGLWELDEEHSVVNENTIDWLMNKGKGKRKCNSKGKPIVGFNFVETGHIKVNCWKQRPKGQGKGYGAKKVVKVVLLKVMANGKVIISVLAKAKASDQHQLYPLIMQRWEVCLPDAKP